MAATGVSVTVVSNVSALAGIFSTYRVPSDAVTSTDPPFGPTFTDWPDGASSTATPAPLVWTSGQAVCSTSSRSVGISPLATPGDRDAVAPGLPDSVAPGLAEPVGAG